MNGMTRDIPTETAVLELETWDTPDHLTDDEFYLETGSACRPGDALFGEREDDR